MTFVQDTLFFFDNKRGHIGLLKLSLERQKGELKPKNQQTLATELHTIDYISGGLQIIFLPSFFS